MKMKMMCIYDGEEWVDTLRIYEVPTGGYVLLHIEDEELHFFYNIDETLQAATRRVSFNSVPRVDTCP
jgi:hypothetical protein